MSERFKIKFFCYINMLLVLTIWILIKEVPLPWYGHPEVWRYVAERPRVKVDQRKIANLYWHFETLVATPGDTVHVGGLSMYKVCHVRSVTSARLKKMFLYVWKKLSNNLADVLGCIAGRIPRLPSLVKAQFPERFVIFSCEGRCLDRVIG